MKKVVLITGGIVLSALLFGFQKATKLREVILNLKASVFDIKNLRWVFDQNIVNFFLDLEIANPTQTNLNFESGTLVTLKRVRFFNQKNELFAEALTDISGININANSSIVLENIPMRASIIQGVQEVVSYFKDNSKVRIELEIEALNQMFTVGLNGTGTYQKCCCNHN